MSITLNRDGYKQVIEDDIDFLNRHFPKELQNHPSYFHITSVLEHSIEYLYEKNNVKPISPKEVTHLIPDFIFEAVNQLIKEKWNGKDATIKQDEIMDIVSSNDDDDPRPARQTIFDNHWLDIEDHYRKAGWRVTYDKPAYCENYDAYFKFEMV